MLLSEGVILKYIVFIFLSKYFRDFRHIRNVKGKIIWIILNEQIFIIIFLKV